MWEETLVFNIQMPQIALVRFQVWDHDPIGRDFIGQRTVAFSSMMPGRYQDMHNLCFHFFFFFNFVSFLLQLQKMEKWKQRQDK